MSNSRTLSDEHRSLVIRLDRLMRERKRFVLKRSVLEATIALSTSITDSAMAQDELTDEIRILLGAVLARQAVAHGRLAGRARAEEWLDIVVSHAIKRVRDEVLT